MLKKNKGNRIAKPRPDDRAAGVKPKVTPVPKGVAARPQKRGRRG